MHPASFLCRGSWSASGRASHYKRPLSNKALVPTARRTSITAECRVRVAAQRVSFRRIQTNRCQLRAARQIGRLHAAIPMATPRDRKAEIPEQSRRHEMDGTGFTVRTLLVVLLMTITFLV